MKRLLSFFKRHIIRTFFIIAENLIPKNTNIIIFAGGGGTRYADNSKYLFEYFVEQGEYDCYWFTDNKEFLNISSLKYRQRILVTRSIYSLNLFLKARTVVISHGRGDVSPYYLCSRYKNVINLWHGIPLKKIGFLDRNTLLTRREYKRYLDESNNYTYMLASSELESYILAAAFKLNIEQLWVTGLPRNDKLVEGKTNDLTSLLNDDSQAKLILFAPTFRDGGRYTEFLPFPDRDIDRFAKFLSKHNAYYLIRAHVDEQDGFTEILKSYPDLQNRIKFAGQDRFADVNEILPSINILITDYSSIYFDFLLLDRPIIFIPYDFQEYVNDRGGFTVDYFQFTAGPKIYTQKELIIHLAEYLDNPNKDAQLRGNMRNLFHYYQDGKACERIYKKISELNK